MEALRLELDDATIDFSTETSSIYGIFRGLLWPEVFLSKKGRICVPEKFSVKVSTHPHVIYQRYDNPKMGGSKSIMRLLMQPDILLSLPVKMASCVLDLLILILQREPYGIVRFQFNDTVPTSSESPVVVKMLMRLLDILMKDHTHIYLAKRVLHLVGITASVGISIQDMKKFMMILRAPSVFTIPTLQALHTMIKVNMDQNKASPTSFFSFGGPGSGLYVHLPSFPFAKEYQFATWFRVENFEEDCCEGNISLGGAQEYSRAFNTNNAAVQHILLWQNPAHKGLDIFLEGQHLMVGVSNHSKVEPTVFRITDKIKRGSEIKSIPIKRGVWYHISVRHAKPRVALFGSDELSITLDGEMIYQDAVRFPNLGNLVDAEFHIGYNFNGQMGPVHFFQEVLTGAAFEALSVIDGGNSSALIEANGLNSNGHISSDLLPAITSADRKLHPILSKVYMAYHPKRCCGHFALDIHNGKHAKMGKQTQPWHMINPRDLLGTLGGVTCLLPLFPRLLVENDCLPAIGASALSSLIDRSEFWGFGLGTSIVDTADEGYAGAYLDYTVVQAMRNKFANFHGDSSISLLLSIVAKCIENHRCHQTEMLHSGAVEMIEYAISCVPPEIMLAEGERCVLSLMGFKSSSAALPALELRVAKLLLCNVPLWSGASFAFLSCLLSVMLEAIKKQPDTFLKLLGVKPLLDALDIFGNFEDDPLTPMGSTDVADAPRFTTGNLEAAVLARSDSFPSCSLPAESAASESSVPVTRRVSFNGVPDFTVSAPEGPPPTGAARKAAMFLDEPAPTTPLQKMPPRASSGKVNKMRKLKSFKLALSKDMFDDEVDQDDQSRLGSIQETLAPLEEADEDEDHDDKDKSKALQIDQPADIDHGASDLSMPSISDLQSAAGSPTKSVEAPLTPQTNFQRRQLREHIHAMIVALVMQGSSEKEVAVLLDYMGSCKDKVVLNELAQVLVHLIAEGSSKMISALITACHGPEEFASFVLVYLVHQAHEELRCSGIRLLSHFYTKVDQATSTALHMSMKKKKNSSLVKALGTLTQSYNAGLQRLHLCGGLALLCEVISSHCRHSTEATYAALLELLMTKGGTVRSGASQFDSYDSAPAQGTRSRQGTVVGAEAPYFTTARPARFAIHYLMLDRDHDENFDLTNSVVMPIFFDLVPKLPIAIQEQIYTDFISLLKHSYGFRQAFVNCPSWHLCMFGLVSQLVNSDDYSFFSKSFHTVDITAELEKWTGLELDESPFQAEERRKMKHKSSGALLRSWNNTSMHNLMMDGADKHRSLPSMATLLAKASPKEKEKEKEAVTQFDLWFDLGMKIYSTLLLHALEHKHGWKEVDRSMALSISNEGYSVAQTILSHLLNELTFKMRPKYKELQRLAKSNNSVENQTATDKLENFLSIMLTASHVALYDRQCVCGRITNFQICKLRVHIYNELARKLINRKNEARPADTGVESPSVKTAEDMQNLTPKEVRSLLEETEVQLQRRVDAAVRDVDEGVLHRDGFGPDGIDVANFEEHIDFFYMWQDITSETVVRENSAATTPPPPVDGTPGKALQTNPYKSTEELLHPLERVHDTLVGKLIIVLQTLRLFDIIFWPHADAVVRNTEMLRFSKEGISPGAGTHNRHMAQEDTSRVQMTMFSAVMRMSMYCLNTLSPMTHLAVLNIKRMRAMICSVDRISPYNTPTHDWLLATVAGVTMNLQRLILIVEPAYNIMGIQDVNLRVRTVGPWADSYDDYDRLSAVDNDRVCAAMLDSATLTKLEQYFHSTPGRNIVRNIRCCLYTLIDAFENHHSKLMSSLEERTYRSLLVLVEQIRADVCASKEPASPQGARPTSPPLGIARNASRTFSQAKVDDVAVDHAGDIFDGPPVSPLPMISFKTRSFSVYSETSSDVNANDVPAADRDAPLSYESFVEDSFSGLDLLLMLKWLRYPLFYANILRNIRVIQALDALDFLEDRSVQRFVKANLAYKEEVENHRDVAIKSVEEMTELKELSREVYEMMAERSDGRQHHTVLAENIKMKNVAARWYDCLQHFEADWSPWNMDGSTVNSIHNPQPGVAYFEIARHRDTKFRNLLLTKLPEPISHVDAAYFESKLKDQIAYEQLVSGGEGAEALVTKEDDSAAATSKNMNLPFKMLTLTTSTTRTTIKDGNAWDDDDVEEDSTDATATASSYTASRASAETQLLGIADVTKYLFQANEKRPTWTLVFNWAPDERILCLLDVTQITIDRSICGQLCLTNKCIYFHYRRSFQNYVNSKQVADPSSSKPFVDQRFYIDRIVEAYSRRYLLQNCAIELFFLDNTELFLAFSSLGDLQRFFKVLKNQALPLLATPRYLNPKHVFKHLSYTEMWRRRLLSNFDYLMKLNIIAGRSHNDITQYPIFPWVLADFSSSELDLASPAVYRNLALPMGALNPSRLQEFLDRYHTFDDDAIPKFMYGSHYSSAGIVLYYLIRQEPYSSLGVAMQNGRFDCPDRMFFNLEKTWQGCNSSMSDVKEMIPELFYNPNVLLNASRLPLGELQEGGHVDDVRLPPWACDAYDFVRIHRDALESDYVSEHLHSWIDLIFGHKQTGSAAVAAQNVFYYLTYENAVDIEAIEDPLERAAAKAQVTHFGQTPSQLLKSAHPRRLPKEECTQPLCVDAKSIAKIQVFTPSASKQVGREHGSALAMRCSADKLVVVHSSFQVCYYRWSAFPEADGTPFVVKPERTKALPSAALACAEDMLKGLQPANEDARHSVDDADAEADEPPSRVALTKGASMAAAGTADASKTSGSGFMASWKSAMKGLNRTASMTSSPAPAAPERGTTLYNATRLEQRGGAARQQHAPPAIHMTRMPSSVLSRRTGASLTPLKTMSGRNVAVMLPDLLSAGRVFSCGYWDDSLKVHAADSLREVASSSAGHIGGITCLQQGYYYGPLLITGGADSTVRVWVVEKPALATALSGEPFYGERLSEELGAAATPPDSLGSALACLHVLWGHSSALACLSFSCDLDVVFSAGSDGLLCVHTARKGSYVRTISAMQGASVDVVLATAPGYLLAHSWSTLQVHIFWVNGQSLATASMDDRVECMVASSNGGVVVCGMASGQVSFRETHSFREIRSISLQAHGAVKCLWFSDDQQFLFAGSQDGTFSVLADPEARLRLLSVAMQKTPLLGSAL